MGRVSDMAIGLQEEARDELLCEIDHWKERAVKAEALLQRTYNHYSRSGFFVPGKGWAFDSSDESELIVTIRNHLDKVQK